MIKIFEAFAGYGGGSFALKKAGIPLKLVGFSEIDKYAIKCFQQNHGGKNYGDITKIDWKKVPGFDLLTGGFPCQDISQAGKQDLKQGRSVLVFELIKALKEKQPKFFLFENVPAIQQEKFKSFLRAAESGMKKAGYKVYRKLLNSKDYGVPQNRERVWFLGYRVDVAPEFGFVPYPKETGCKLRLLDVCDKEVDEKYYLSDKAVNFLIRRMKENLKNNRGFGAVFNPKTCSTIYSRYGALRNSGETYVSSPLELTKGMFQGMRVYSPNSIGISLNSQGGGWGAKTGLYMFPCAIRQRDRHGKRESKEQQLEIGKDVCNSLTSVHKDSLLLMAQEGKIKIRRLTPTECFRLMGFQDEEIDLSRLSDTQKYKLAGNGWDVNLVSKIFSHWHWGV